MKKINILGIVAFAILAIAVIIQNLLAFMDGASYIYLATILAYILLAVGFGFNLKKAEAPAEKNEISAK